MTEQERIVLTRWSPWMALGVVAATGVLALGPLWGLVNARTTTDRALLSAVTVVFALPLMWALWRIPRTLRGMGILVDSNGIHPFDGRHTETIEWAEIAKVGFGAYSRTHRGIKPKSVSGLEVYRSGDEEPSFRYTLSPYGTGAERIEQAVKRFHPQLWAGPFTHER